MVQRLRRIRRFSSPADDLGDFLLTANKLCPLVPWAALLRWFVRRRCIGSWWRSQKLVGSRIRNLQSTPRRQSQSALHNRFPRRRGWLRKRSSYGQCAKIISCNTKRGKNGMTSSPSPSLFGISAQGRSTMPMELRSASRRHDASAVQFLFHFP